jgi:type I restriction enzyme S subunit
MFGDPILNEKGWPSKSIKESAVRLSDGPFGSNLKSEHYSETGVRVIRLQNICEGYFLDDDKAYVSLEHYEKIKKYTCKSGEIIIGTLGEPNLRACIIPEYVGYAINKADCVHYIPNPEYLDTAFVVGFLNSPIVLNYALGDAHGNTRQRISSGQISKMPIIIPPMELQKQYAVIIQQTDKSKFNFQIAIYRTVWSSRR